MTLRSGVARAGRRVLGPPLRGDRGTTWQEAARLATRSLRVLPDFLIIGTAKGGTTALFVWLSRHPDVAAPIEKEIHYFDDLHDRGARWYRAHFPTVAERARDRRLRHRSWVTGEATPYYLLHPHAPRRAAALVPGARLVALLRDPVDRAYSLHQHRLRIGLETLPFGEALDAEEERLAGEAERMAADDSYVSFELREHSYLRGGEYLAQLEAWWAHFPREQLLVLRSEDLYERSSETFGRVLDHIGVPRSWEPHWYDAINAGEYRELDAGLRRRLTDHFEPHNRRLAEALGEPVWWGA